MKCEGLDLVNVDVVNVDVGGVDVMIPVLPSKDHLVSFRQLTILTGQSHISKVVVLSQVSNISTLPFILAKYFI